MIDRVADTVDDQEGPARSPGWRPEPCLYLRGTTHPMKYAVFRSKCPFYCGAAWPRPWNPEGCPTPAWGDTGMFTASSPAHPREGSAMGHLHIDGWGVAKVDLERRWGATVLICLNLSHQLRMSHSGRLRVGRSFFRCSPQLGYDLAGNPVESSKRG